MSQISQHSLCSKLQKWIHHKAHSSVNGCNSLCSHGHTHSNAFIASSPYKKTTFQTLLRRYPQNEDQLKFSRPNFQNEMKENPKRTFESRILKYDNIKSKINTNLANLKSTKHQSLSIVNDENKNTDNMTLNPHQNENEKFTFQKPLIKKIKLNSQFFKAQQKNNSQTNCSQNDVEQMIKSYNFRAGQYQQKSENGQTLFRINVAKRINLLNKNHNTEDLSEEDQKEKDFIARKDDNQSPIILQSPEKQQDNISSKHLPESVEKLYNFENNQKLIFKELGEKNYEMPKINDDLYDQDEMDIFTLDGYKILDDNDEIAGDQIQNKQEHLEGERQMMPASLKQIQEYEGEQSEIAQSEADQPIHQIIMHSASFEDEDSVLSKMCEQIPQSESILIEKILEDQPIPTLNQKENLSQNIQTKQEVEHPKQKPQKSRKNSKPKKETKILTRSKEEKLNLLNKISMRLIRKRYGPYLSHTQLADKMLSHENRIELKAFIESGSFQSQKTVFDFNELTISQMKSTLIKYFAQEQKDPKSH